MAAPQSVARTAPKLALLALTSLGLGAACYSTTPHRVEVATQAAPQRCTDAIADVFSRSGFIQLPTPRHWSMLFGARVGGPYSSFLSTGSGIGVVVDHDGDARGTCHVTLEALSPDVGCPGGDNGPSGTLNCRASGAPADGPWPYAATTSSPMCPLMPSLMCELTSAPGADNDAAVDELARRLRTALGPSGHVN